MHHPITILYVCLGSTESNIFTSYFSCLLHSIYQTIKTIKESNYTISIKIIVSDCLYDSLKNNINRLDVDIHNEITLIKTSLLDRYRSKYIFENCETYKKYRDSFWINTTLRFYYIDAYYNSKNCDDIVIHLENDVLLFEIDDIISNYFIESSKDIFMVLDSPLRVVPSIIKFSGVHSSNELIKHINLIFNKNKEHFINDMELLAAYPHLKKLKYCIDDDNINDRVTNDHKKEVLYDGAFYGQFLSGIDLRNLKNFDNLSEKYKLNLLYNNPTIGFKNETTVGISHHIKLSDIVKKDGCYYYNNYKLANLHIHSKQLFLYTYNFDYKYTDIITGDRVIELCSCVIIKKPIRDFHVSFPIDKNNVLNYLENFNYELYNKSDKIFIYTHILDEFLNILEHELRQRGPPLYKDSYKTFYIHNSDHCFTDSHYKKFVNIFGSNNFKIYSQNIMVNKSSVYDELNLLPIGIANMMWSHGSLEDMFTVMKKQIYKKNKYIYIPYMSSTHIIRLQIIEQLTCMPLCLHYTRGSKKDFIDYLDDINEHKFCLCVQGNGPDTHRFWECLYMKCIPIVLSESNNFIRYLDADYPMIYCSDYESFKKFINKSKDELDMIYKEKIKELNPDMLKINSYDY